MTQPKHSAMAYDCSANQDSAQTECAVVSFTADGMRLHLNDMPSAKDTFPECCYWEGHALMINTDSVVQPKTRLMFLPLSLPLFHYLSRGMYMRCECEYENMTIKPQMNLVFLAGHNKSIHDSFSYVAATRACFLRLFKDVLPISSLKSDYLERNLFTRS